MALGECQPTAASVSRLIPRTLPALAPDPSVAPAKSESTIPRLDQHPDTAYPSTQSSSFPSQSPASAVPSSLSAQSSFHPTMQEDTNIAQSAPSPTPDTLGAVPSGAPSPAPAPSPSLDVDPQIIEALRSKDRIYVLKLGEMFEALIMERRCVSHSVSNRPQPLVRTVPNTRPGAEGRRCHIYLHLAMAVLSSLTLCL